MEEQQTILSGFKGLWARGSYTTCPPDHLTDCYNCVFPGNDQVTIRPSFIFSSTVLANCIWYTVARCGSTDILITLSDDGKLRDETNAVLLHTYNPLTVNSFASLSIFGRIYLCATFNSRAVSGEVVYSYDGTNFRQAAGIAPVTPVILTQPNAGIVDPGIHQIAVSFLYATGYLSPPSPLVAITSDGVHNIHIANIPIGGAGVVGRVLLITLANQSELYFIPGGTINNNTATTFDYDQYDTVLLESADYLNDIITSIPSCSAIRFYKGRVVYIGQYGAPDQILVSNILFPENVNSVAGLINLPVDSIANAANTGAVIQDILYLIKPNGIYSTQDNGGDPDTWGVTLIDSGLGCYDNGMSAFSSSASSQDILDTTLCVNKRGLLLFNGAFADPPLSYKIESIWQLIDSRFISNVQIAHDAQKKLVFIAAPLIPGVNVGDKVKSAISTNNSLILMMDYKEGLSPTAVKWSVWTSASFPIKRLYMENFTLAGFGSSFTIYQLTFCNGSTTIYSLNPQVNINGGTVNTAGNLVTLVSGNDFLALSTGDNINIAGTDGIVALILDSSHLLVQTPLPTLAGASYYASLGQDNNLGDYNIVSNGYIPINQYVISPVISPLRGVNVFNLLEFDVIGHGQLSFYIFNKDRLLMFTSIRGFALDAYKDVNLYRQINFQTEGIQVAFQANSEV
jgi:hypothetical protein